MTYFPAGQYHRQRRLNCCVRDGNRCRPSLMFTDKPIGPRFRGSTSRPKALRAPGNRTDEQTRIDLSMNSNSAWQGPGFLIEARRRPLCFRQPEGPEPKGREKPAAFAGPLLVQRARSVPSRAATGLPVGSVSRRLVGMTKRSTVSTAQLRTLLSVHMRPINLVVYQGSFVLRPASLILRGASRLDAFSGYPCHT